ncbi:Protein transport protein yif1 [Microbotryomycetes sp. JL221]|nr:Protein transport protein yif1 [Microbotryomycetes sp. JL221]
MYGARSPPPLQHPRPQHPPSQIPSTSPPPPEFNNHLHHHHQQQQFQQSHHFQPQQQLHHRGAPTGFDDAGYQRFSSPGLVQQQQQQQRPMYNSGFQDPYSTSTSSSSSSVAPSAAAAAAAFGATGPINQSHSFQQQQQQQPWMNGFMPTASTGAPQGDWPGMNDATAQMGMQLGKHAFDAGQAYIDKNLTRMVPLTHLKHSFNVSNGYVLTKLKLVLWPWRHRPWSRTLKRNETSGVAEGYQPPRDDINCPDLYIPVMSLVTYILLSAIYAGKQGQFDPQILGQTASKAFGLLFLEFCCIKLGCYLLRIGEEGTMVDLLAYEGYKFVGVIVTLLAGLLGVRGWSFWIVFLYTLCANFFFQLRSLRHIILPDPAGMMTTPLDHATNSMTASTGAGNSHAPHAARSRRIQFLFMIALAQGLSMAVLVRV